MNDYRTQLESAKDSVVEVLRGKGIQQRHLVFGGEGPEPEKKVRPPTDARSEFLANRAMGDWAEGKVSEAVASIAPSWSVTQYGNTNSMAAGEEGFADHYRAALEEVREFGKRPDLLVLPKGVGVPADISTLARADSDPFVFDAQAAIEVRSSKFNALKYMAVRKAELEAGKKSDRATPSFTVKVEDLVVVYRWIERYGVSQSYCQVFFDSMWAINVLDIFRIIGSGAGFKIETPAKSQLKSTIMIPITSGVKVGAFTEAPVFEVETRETKLGRVDAFVKPVGGKVVIDGPALRTVLLAEAPQKPPALSVSAAPQLNLQLAD
jgi:hypothetical protein